MDKNEDIENRWIHKGKSDEVRNKLLRSPIICCTLSKAVIITHLFGNGEVVEISIIDEASQVTEDSVLGTVYPSTKNLILFGDPKQLSPILCDDQNIEEEVDMFFQNIVEEYLEDIVQLRIQYRMHPSIINYVNNRYYGGTLINGVTSEDRRSPETLNSIFHDMDYPKIFVDMDSRQSRVGTSLKNKIEARAILSYLRRFRRAGIRFNQIGIICT